MSEKDVGPEAMKKAIATLDSIKSMAGVGMSQVDPKDIRPPRVLLVQNIKDKTDLKDKSGKECPDGHFFSDGNNEIFDKMPCYFLYAEKGTHINKKHPEYGDLDKYDVIGMKEDGQLFTITFKNTSRNAMSKLFTATKVNGYPMFAFKCSLEAKLISDDEKSWYVAVVRVGELETDGEILGKAMELAKEFDSKKKFVDDVASTIAGQSDDAPPPSDSEIH